MLEYDQRNYTMDSALSLSMTGVAPLEGVQLVTCCARPLLGRSEDQNRSLAMGDSKARGVSRARATPLCVLAAGGFGDFSGLPCGELLATDLVCSLALTIFTTGIITAFFMVISLRIRSLSFKD